MLTFNVAGLLQATPAAARTYPVHGAIVVLEAEGRCSGPIGGHVRLARTNRGLLVEVDLATELDGACGRCLRPIRIPIAIRFEEEALPTIDLLTGQAIAPATDVEALQIDEHHDLDLSESVRQAILLGEPIAPLCRPDCRGLCPDCGLDLDDHPGHDHGPASIDPRLAELAAWRPPASPPERPPH